MSVSIFHAAKIHDSLSLSPNLCGLPLSWGSHQWWELLPHIRIWISRIWSNYRVSLSVFRCKASPFSQRYHTPCRTFSSIFYCCERRLQSCNTGGIPYLCRSKVWWAPGTLLSTSGTLHYSPSPSSSLLAILWGKSLAGDWLRLPTDKSRSAALDHTACIRCSHCYYLTLHPCYHLRVEDS